MRSTAILAGLCLLVTVTFAASAPTIVVPTDTVVVTLFTGQQTTRSVSLQNTGPDTLTWTADIVTASVNPLPGLRVLVDKTNRAGSEQNDGGVFTGILASHGAILGEHTDPTITPDALAGWDVFLMHYFNSGLSAEELDALEGFVRGGGGLLAREHHSGTTMTELMNRLGAGIEFDSNWGFFDAGVSSDFGSTELTVGIGAVGYERAVRYVKSVTAPAEIVSWFTGGTVVHTARCEVNGRVFGLGAQFLDDVNIGMNGNVQFGLNIMRWLASATPGLSVAPPAGFTVGGGADSLLVGFDATYLGARVSEMHLEIPSNDPVTPVAVVPIRFTVNGTPLTALSTAALAFSPRHIGYFETRSLIVRNDGNADLLATLSCDDPSFAPVDSIIVVPPGDSTSVAVEFAPVAAGAQTGTLTLDTNQLGGTPFQVSLTGTGLVPADITVIPDSIHVAVLPGDTTSVSVTFGNDGPGGQRFEAVVLDIQGQPGTVPVVFDNFEDGDWLGWTDSGAGGTLTVAGDGGGAGSTFSFEETLSPGGHQSGIYRLLPAVNPGFISFWVKPHTDTDNACYFTVRDGANREVIFFFAQGNGQFYCNANVGGHNSFPYSADTWYHVEFRDIDFTAKTFDYVVDDALVQADISFRNAADVTEFSRFDLYHYGAGAGGNWDNVVIPSVPATDWITASPAGATVAMGGTLPIDINIDAGAVPIGAYDAVLTLRTDHPLTQVFSVPVHVVVDTTATGVNASSTPRRFVLRQNYPNPFNPTTTVAFDLPWAGEVSLIVYDVGGRRVRTLVSGYRGAGAYAIDWDGTNDDGARVASGVYLYRLVAGSQVQTRKMVLLK